MKHRTDIALIEKIVFKSIQSLSDESPDFNIKPQKNTKLLGPESNFDSLDVVNLLVIIEQNIEDEFNVNVTLADERAMSQKHSPFRTAGALVDYINILLEEI